MPDAMPSDRSYIDPMTVWMSACNPALVWLLYAQPIFDGWIAGTETDDLPRRTAKIVPFPNSAAAFRCAEKRTVILCL